MGKTASKTKEVEDIDFGQICQYGKEQLIHNGFDCLKDSPNDQISPPEIQFVEMNLQAELEQQSPNAYIGFWGKFRTNTDYNNWSISKNWKTFEGDFQVGDLLCVDRECLSYHYFHWGIVVEVNALKNRRESFIHESQKKNSLRESRKQSNLVDYVNSSDNFAERDFKMRDTTGMNQDQSDLENKQRNETFMINTHKINNTCDNQDNLKYKKFSSTVEGDHETDKMNPKTEKKSEEPKNPDILVMHYGGGGRNMIFMDDLETFALKQQVFMVQRGRKLKGWNFEKRVARLKKHVNSSPCWI